MADFMQNSMDPIEPVNFGISDAVARAYQYLMDKERLLKAPGQIMSSGVNAGAGLIQDRLANMAASLMGAQRPDPDVATNAAMKKAAPAAEELGGAGKTLTDAMGSLRGGAVNAMGWKDLPANAATPVPAGQTRAPRPDVVASGAIPAAPRRVVAPRTPGGALPVEAPQIAETPGNGDLYAPQAGGNTAEVVNTQPRAAEPPQKGLREQYMERLASMDKKAPAGMTDEQKGQALMEAGLAIMAAGAKPGASALGAIGQGGQAGTAVAREMQRINRERADKMRAEDRANINTEFQLAGQDEDRAIRKEDKEEGRRIREEDLNERSADRKERNANDERKIELLKQQIEAGKTQVVNNDKTGTMIVLNTTTNEQRDTGIKFHKADGRPAAIQLVDALMADPKKMAAYKEIYGEKGGMSDKDVINDAVKLAGEQVKGGSTENTEALLQRNADAIRRAAGKPVAAPSRDAQAAAVREQFRQKQITKEQAVQQLQKLGYQ